MWTCPDCGRQFKRKNQNHFCRGAPKTVGEYIDRQPRDIREKLRDIARCFSDVLPQAEVRLSWGMPTWKGRKNIVNLAVHKDSITIYAYEEAVARFSEGLADIPHEGGTIRLPLDRQPPLKLLGEIAAMCGQMDKE